MAPGSIFHHISFRSISFCNLYFPIYTIKIPKIFILLSLSDLTFASGREGIDNPFIALVARFLFVSVGASDFWGASYWIDTLVLKNWGKYLRYFAASSSPLRGNPTHCSRGSKKDFWRRCRGGLRSSQYIPSTHHKPISLALHYLPFASRFPLPHFTLAVLFALLPFNLVLPCAFFLLVYSLAKSLWILIHLLINLRYPIMMNLLLVSWVH